ncbi:MAG: hypothetical protein MUD05_02275 [Candidatus Nanopelagicales bacterium]|nr:hypothetical protein [Candidatus Nanopelagicales bacterium]
MRRTLTDPGTSSAAASGLDGFLTLSWVLAAATAPQTWGRRREWTMRGFVAWLAIALMSVLTGVVLYTTSLGGSATDYREAVISPRPVPTVVKTRTKIKTKVIRKPAKTKIVYVPQPVPQTVSQPEPVAVDSATTTREKSSPSSHDEGDDDD